MRFNFTSLANAHSFSVIPGFPLTAAQCHSVCPSSVGSVFPYEPLEEQVPIPQRHSARLYGQLALAVAWRQGMSLDNLLGYHRHIGDILQEGVINQSPREQGIVRDHYQHAAQFFADNPKTTLLAVAADNLEPVAGDSVLLEEGTHSLLVLNEGSRYQLYSPDFNYRQRFYTRPGVSWAELSAFAKAFFLWKSGRLDYHPLTLRDPLPEKALLSLQVAAGRQPDKLAPDRVLLAERQHGLIEGIPATAVRELISVQGQVVDWTALHADFFQTAGIQLRLDKLHQVLPELSDEQRRHLVRLVNRYDWAADNSILERCSAEERVVLADYQQRAMAELKQAETITPERLSELSWQALGQAIEEQPELPEELKQPVLDNLKAMRSSTTRRAWAKGMATQALFFLPDMIRAANTGQVGGLTSTAGMLAADGGVNHLYGRLLERLAPTLSETRLAILQKLPVTSPVFKALTVYSIVELTQQLATLPVDSPQRQTIKHRLGEQYFTIGLMAAELLGLETGPLWIGLMAEQLIFEAITFRKENQLDIPFWEALIMSLGFEQNKLQHIVEERQLVDVNLATVDNINTQANPPYGWVLVKVPFLGRPVWQPIDEWQVPNEVYQTVTRQPDSLVRALTVTREAAGFRQIEHYEAGKSVVIPGGFASVTRGRWLNTVWYQSTYAAQAAAIEVQLAPQNYQSRQEDNVFLRTVTLQGTNTTYQCAAAVEGQQYRYVTTHRPLRITGKGLAALYRGNTSSTAAQRNLYLGFDPREGDITLYIPSSGLYRLNNLTAPTGVYHLTVQVGNKNYPESIILPPRGGRLYIEDRSQQLNSLYFIRRQSAPVYLYDETSVTRVAFETVESPAKGFIIWGRVTNILQWHAAPTASNVTLQAPPYQHNLCVKGAVAAPAQPPFYQVNTLCLQGKKQSLQLQLTQQRIANVLMLSAQQVEVLSARGEDAYHSGIYLYSTVTHFDITVVGHLQIMQEQTHLFVIGENPDNTPAIHYTKNPGMPYQLTLATLQPVIDTLHRPNPQERHFSAPGVRFSWVAGEPAAVLQIVGRYQGQSAQLLLERDNATLSQSAFHQTTRTLVVFHFTDSVALDPQLRLQQVLPANHTGPGLQFQSPQGDEVLHYFEHDRFTINGIHYQVHGKRLYATGAESGVIEGKQLIRDRHPGQGVGIRIHSSLNQSVLARDNQTWSINQLKLHQLPERTLIYFEHQTFPWQALQETPQHPHRHHHQSRHRRQIPNVASSAQRPTSWITNLWKGLLGRFPTDTRPSLPQPSVSLTPSEYTAEHLQGGLQLLDLVIRKWTGKKYSPPTLTLDFDTDDNRRTMASQLAYAAQCPTVTTLKQSLATENHESHATTPQEPWLAYPLPTTDTHNLPQQLT
ncbi:MAG: hypothetical protein ACMZI2_07900 (plasmid) [Candidatus Symbiodolus clandestinus]